MMITVLLYGFLGKQFGKVHHYDINSPGEAIRALSVNFPGFRRALIDGGAYRVLRGGRAALGVDDLRTPQSARESLRIVPVVQGARGLGQILMGAALFMAAGPVGAQLELAAFSAEVSSAFVGYVTSGMSAIGLGLMLNGVSSMLFSPVKTQSTERPENKPSYAFDGPVNTSTQGNPVPVCYGRAVVGSQVISAGLSVDPL